MINDIDKEIDARMCSVQAGADQAWSSVAPYIEDLLRLTNNPPKDECDRDILRMAASIVAGEIIMRQTQINIIESREND